MRARFLEIWHLVRDAYQEFNRDAGDVTAGAIAFFATLSLVPIALLATSLLGHFLGSAEAFAQVERVMQQLLPGANQEVLAALRAYSAPSRLLVNVVGSLGLLWSGLNLFALLSQILTTIWVGQPVRGFLAQRLVGLLCLLGGGALFLANLVLTSFAAALNAQEAKFGALSPYLHDLLGASPYLISGALAALTFFLLYRFLPAGKVSTRAATAAAVPASLLWVLSRYLFAILVAGSSHYGQLYGPLAGAVVLLLWIYYSAYIMIFCAELGATAQQRYWPKT